MTEILGNSASGTRNWTEPGGSRLSWVLYKDTQYLESLHTWAVSIRSGRPWASNVLISQKQSDIENFSLLGVGSKPTFPIRAGR
jgi:hypothetical protein